MDSVRDLIAKKLKERGLTMKAASLQIGKSHAYLQQFLERGVPASLPEGPRGLLAALLQVPEDSLRGPTLSSGRAVAGKGALPRGPQIGTIDKLPVLGMAQCGPDGLSLWNGDIVDYKPRPAALADVAAAYAVYAVGSSMEPRYFPGELVHVHPGRPVEPGDFVLVQIRPRDVGDAVPRALLKRLVRRSGSKIVLEQYNPKKSFELKTDEIVSMHRVVASGEA
jgi:phage repressor protein C with HTH and peptisase S24 domain